MSGTLHIPRCSNNETSKRLPFLKQPYFESFHQDLTETVGTKAQLGKNHHPSPFKFAKMTFFPPPPFSFHDTPDKGKSKGEFCAIPQVNKMKTLPIHRTRRSDLQHPKNKPQLYHRTIFSYMAQSSHGVSSPSGSSSFSPTACSPVFWGFGFFFFSPCFTKLLDRVSQAPSIPAFPSPPRTQMAAMPPGARLPKPEMEGEAFNHATRHSAGWGGC